MNPHDFEALFATHAAFVWRVLKRHGVPESELEDACQDVFLVVHRRIDEFEGRSTLRTWIYGIAVRVALGLRRKTRLRHEMPAQPGSEPQALEPTQLELAAQRQALTWVEAALGELSPDQREAFVLYELEGLSSGEVAAALGVPESTLLYRLYAARDRVRAFVRRRMAVPARSTKPNWRRSVR